MADETKATGAATPPESEDYADYAAWRAAREAASAADDDETRSEAPAEEPEAESAEEADASDESLEGDEDSDADEQAGAEQPKRKGGFQRRIDKLTREKRELEARIAALEARLAGGAEKAPAGEAEEKAPAAEPQGKPRPEDFDTYEAYTEALTDWKLEQRERERAQREAERQVFESWLARIEAARKAHPDFDEVVDSDTPVSPAMQQAILESEHGAEIAYWLGKHPEEAERIAKLPPIAAIREIGRIEASLSTKTPSPKPKATITRAPKPVTPVTGGKAGAASDVYDASLAEDYTAWERARRAELKRKAS